MTPSRLDTTHTSASKETERMSAKRLDEVMAAQRACDLLDEVRRDFLYKPDLMLENATCVLS